MAKSEKTTPAYELMFQQFDPEWYADNYMENGRDGDREEIFRFYLSEGAKSGHSPNDAFDEQAYLSKYEDVKEEVELGRFLCGFEHFVLFGQKEGRSTVDPESSANDDLTGGTGRSKEQSQPNWYLQLKAEFQPDWYMQQHEEAQSEIEQLRIQPFDHYLNHVTEKAYSPNDWFNEEFYRYFYKDIHQAIKNGIIRSGFEHYINSGRTEGRKCTLSLKERLEIKYPGITAPVGISNFDAIETKLIPIPTVKSSFAHKRINFLLPTIDPDIMYGGYAAALQLILKISARGIQVRVIICEDATLNEAFALYLLKARPDLYDTFSTITIVNCSLRARVLDISKNDRFIAYSAWTAFLAHDLAVKTDSQFVFLIQEFEAIFHAHDSFCAIVESAYKLPHIPIFNTAALKSFFEQHRIGIFGHSDIDSPSVLEFEHPLVKAPPEMVAERLNTEPKHRFLLYARPEAHAARNLFELCIMALKRAILEGVFDDTWTFHGIGSFADHYSIDLGNKITLTIQPKLSESNYARALCDYDVGMSLMMAPHPSLLPYEMASAGILAVTNTYENRNIAFFNTISSNIIPADLTIAALSRALKTAVSRVDDVEARVAAAKSIKKNTWDRAFNERFVKKLLKELK